MHYTNSHAGPWRRKWTLSLTQCYNCGFVFNFWHGRRPSMAARRNGPYWDFRCPGCNRKTAFDLRSSSFDRAQPTYSDASKLFAMFFQIPMAAALLTLLVFAIVNSGDWVGFTLLLLVIEETLLVANFVVIAAISWYYTHRVKFERIA